MIRAQEAVRSVRPACRLRLVNAALDGLEQQFLLSHGTVDIATPLAAFLDRFYVH